MDLRSFPQPPPFLKGGAESPFPSSPSTSPSSGSPERDLREEEEDDDDDREADVVVNHLFSPLTSTPLGKVPPNSALPTPDMKTPSGASSSEPSPPGTSYGHPYGYGEREGDFWSSIQKHYDELMDDGLIEKCKDVESDFSLDEESDSPAASTVSFTEFLDQYKELSDWLKQMKHATVQTVHSQSEKYLNQSYHEEMLQRSPRRKLFKDYARRLQRRFPNLKEDICSRLAHLNRQWKELEAQITGRKSDDQLEVTFVDDALRTPVFNDEDGRSEQSFISMSADLEADLEMLKNWVTSVENRLGPLTLRKVQEMGDLEEKLTEYQSIQKEIESQARVISAVFKLCDRLDSHRFDETSPFARDDADEGGCGDGSAAAAKEAKLSARRGRRSSLRSEASKMENRWHKVWLLALEWQCCLEERLSSKVVKEFCFPSPYLVDKARSLPPGRWSKPDPNPSKKPVTTTTTTTPLSSLDDPAAGKKAKATDEAPSLDDEKGSAEAEGAAAAAASAAASAAAALPETAHVSVGTDNVCKCGFLGENVVCAEDPEAESGGGGVKGDGEEPILCSRCKRPTKDFVFDAENLIERDALLSVRDDADGRAERDLLRLFHQKDLRYVVDAAAARGQQQQQQQRRAEPHDIGYSSEGLSNDEDSVFSPRVLAPRDTGLDTLSEAPKYEQDATGSEAKFFPPAALEVFHVQNVEERQQQHLQQQQHHHHHHNRDDDDDPEGQDAMERLKLKYGLRSVSDSTGAESSDVSSGGFKPGCNLPSRSRRDSLGSASAATDLDHTETDPLEKTPPRHRKSLVRRDGIQKLVLEVEDLIAHERDKCAGGGGGGVLDDSTLTRKSVRRPRSFPSEEASAEFTSTEDVSYCGNDDDDDEEEGNLGESLSHSSDWDFCRHRRDGDGVSSSSKDAALNVTARSVTEMYEQSLGGIDLSPFAIDDDESEDSLDAGIKYYKNKINNSNNNTFPRACRRNLNSDGFSTMPKSKEKSHKIMALSGVAPLPPPPQTEEFYISDQVWEYDDFGGEKCRPEAEKEGRSSPDFFAAHDDDDDDDDFRFRPASTDDVDEDAVSDQRRSDASYSSTPPPPPNFLFKPLAPASRRCDGGVGSGGAAASEDSDSDCEELRHVLQESRAQLQVTDVTLGKIKREMIERGNFLEPSKYKELLATCQTNIKCLQVIHQHLKTPNPTSIPDDVGEIEEIIERWEVLQAVTADKQSRCRVLKELSAGLMSAVEFRDEAAAALADPRRVDDAAQLDAFVFDLRNFAYEIDENRAVLAKTRDGLAEFADSNPRYSVQRMRDSADVVDAELAQMRGLFDERVSQLDELLLLWTDADEKIREAAFGVESLRRPGRMLRRKATTMVMKKIDDEATNGDDGRPQRAAMGAAASEPGSQSEMNALIEEDERTLRKRAKALEEEIDAVDRSSRRIETVASQSGMENLSLRFYALRREIDDLTKGEWIDGGGEKSWMVAESDQSEVEADESAIAAEVAKGTGDRSTCGMLRKSSKYVVVIFLVLALLLGLALIVSPDCCFTRNNLKWSLQPQLRYSDGPPPQ